MHLWDYLSISMFSPDLSSTVKWSSQTMIRSSHRFTRASPKASKRAGGCLMKVLQLVDADNLCVFGSSIDRTFFSLFPEFENLIGNLVVKVLQEVNQHKLTIQLRLLKIINDTASLNNSSVVSNVYTPTIATVYKGNIIKNLIMDCQSYAKYRPNETTGGIFVSWRRKEELPTGA